MKFSILYDLRHPEQQFGKKPLPEIYSTFLQQSEEIDELGYDCIWITEHHYSPEDRWISAALPMCAAVAARTKHCDIGTGIIALPLHDPVRVAEQVSIVDNISNGRARLGVAIGYRVEEFRTDILDRKERVPRMVEGIDLITRCWTQDDFDFDGDFYKVKGMTMAPKPVQDPPPIYIAGQAPVSVKRAAHLGHHVFPNASRNLRTAWEEGLAEAGNQDRGLEYVAFPDQIYVTNDPDGDWAAYEHMFMYRWLYYDKAYSDGTDVPLISVEERRRRLRKAIFRPEEAVEYVQSLIDRNNPTEVAFLAGFPGMPLEVSHRSLKLFATEVMPKFK